MAMVELVLLLFLLQRRKSNTFQKLFALALCSYVATLLLLIMMTMAIEMVAEMLVADVAVF